MTEMTTGLVSPRYRHFFPVAPSFSVPVAGLKSAGLSRGVIQVRAAGFKQETATQYIYDVGNDFAGASTVDINLYIDGVYQNNNYGFYGKTVPVYDLYGYQKTDPVTGLPMVKNILEYEKYVFDDQTHQIILTKRMTRPDVGATIRAEMLIGYATQQITSVPMKKYLLQGLDPIDQSLTNPRDPSALHFQGAYRCTLEIVSKPTHGVLRMSPDQLGFEYRPEVGYYGDDTLVYRVINCMGQESPCGVITFKVGTVKS